MEIKKFLGVKNTTSAERLKPGELTVAQNVDLDDTGKLLTRLGTTLAQAGGYHSLWAEEGHAYVMAGSDLNRVNLDLSLTFVARLTTPERVAFKRELNTIYFSNGTDTGRIHEGAVKGWGVPNPAGQPRCAAGAGRLPPGTYSYAVTFGRADGYESGTGAAGSFELTAPGGLQLTEIPSSTDPEVSVKLVYISGPNGVELFRAAAVPASAASATVMDLPSGARLETDFASPAPAGTILETHSGVMYVVAGDSAFYTDPYQFERFRRATQFLQFPGPVTMFAAVNDGIYVSTPEATWFLEGTEPRKLVSKKKFDYGAIPGTAVKTTVGTLKLAEEGQEGAPGGTAVMWTTPHGVCVGAEGGVALNMTERTVSFPGGQRGSAVIRQVRGYTQYLAALEGTGVAANAYE